MKQKKSQIDILIEQTFPSYQEGKEIQNKILLEEQEKFLTDFINYSKFCLRDGEHIMGMLFYRDEFEIPKVKIEYRKYDTSDVTHREYYYELLNYLANKLYEIKSTSSIEKVKYLNILVDIITNYRKILFNRLSKIFESEEYKSLVENEAAFQKKQILIREKYSTYEPNVFENLNRNEKHVDEKIEEYINFMKNYNLEIPKFHVIREKKLKHEKNTIDLLENKYNNGINMEEDIPNIINIIEIMTEKVIKNSNEKPSMLSKKTKFMFASEKMELDRYKRLIINIYSKTNRIKGYKIAEETRKQREVVEYVFICDEIINCEYITHALNYSFFNGDIICNMNLLGENETSEEYTFKSTYRLKQLEQICVACENIEIKSQCINIKLDSFYQEIKLWISCLEIISEKTEVDNIDTHIYNILCVISDTIDKRIKYVFETGFALDKEDSLFNDILPMLNTTGKLIEIKFYGEKKERYEEIIEFYKIITNAYISCEILIRYIQSKKEPKSVSSAEYILIEFSKLCIYYDDLLLHVVDNRYIQYIYYILEETSKIIPDCMINRDEFKNKKLIMYE